jgi:hypothetical protein
MLKRLVGFLVVLSLVFLPLSCGGEEEPVGKPGSDDGLTGDENTFAGQLLVHDFMWDRTDAGISTDLTAFNSFVLGWNRSAFAVVEDASIISLGSSYVPVEQKSVAGSVLLDGVGKYRYSQLGYLEMAGKQYSDVAFDDIEFSGKFTAVLRNPLNKDNDSVQVYRKDNKETLENLNVLDIDDKTAWYGWNPVTRLVDESVSFKFPAGWDKRYVVPPGYVGDWNGDRFSPGASGTGHRYSGFLFYDSYLREVENDLYISSGPDSGHKLGYWQLLASLPEDTHLLHSVEAVVGVVNFGKDDILAGSFGESARFAWNLHGGGNYYYGIGSGAEKYKTFADKVKKFVNSVSVGNKVLLKKEDVLNVSFSESVPEGFKVYVGLMKGNFPVAVEGFNGDLDSFTAGMLESYTYLFHTDGDSTFMAQDIKQYNGSPLGFDVSVVVGYFEEQVEKDYFDDSQKFVPDFERRENDWNYNGKDAQDGVWDGVSYVYDYEEFMGPVGYLWSDYVYTKEDWRSEKFPLRVMVYLLKDE